MSLVLERQAETSIPVEVDGVTPANLASKSEREIARQKIWFGRRNIELGELFRVSGRIDETCSICWTGNLQSVHRIGAGMHEGTMEIETAAGRHVGSQMSGGAIVAQSNVSDFLGAEMTGGTIRVAGNAGDGVGGNYPGSKYGMNRGAIIIKGDVGRGCGQAMRRGTIAVAGNAGRLCGWNMLAGSIVVAGSCGRECGANMIRGTIIIAGSSETPLLPTFALGGVYDQYLMGITAAWLKDFDFAPARQLMERQFLMYHGDLLRGGRGEVFIAMN